MKAQNFFKVDRSTNLEDLAESLNNQLTETIAENIKLNMKLRILTDNYNELIKDYNNLKK